MTIISHLFPIFLPFILSASVFMYLFMASLYLLALKILQQTRATIPKQFFSCVSTQTVTKLDLRQSVLHLRSIRSLATKKLNGLPRNVDLLFFMDFWLNLTKSIEAP